MDKLVFAVFDKQTPEDLLKIKAAVTIGFESPHKGFEELILEETDKIVLENFAIELISNGEWPTHLTFCKPCNTSTIEDIKKGLLEYFRWSKGARSCAALLSTCSITEMPSTIKSNLSSISMLC